MGVVARSLMAGLPEIADVPGWEVATVVVTVKAYPAIAQKSGESVCVAGVRIDRDEPEWIRLFPVGFRALPPDRQFVKYQVVRLRVRRGGSDRRPESFKPDLGSLVLGPTIGPDHAWRRAGTYWLRSRARRRRATSPLDRDPLGRTRLPSA